MVNLKIFNKEDLGKSLIPNKIWKLEYKKELEKLYNKIHFNNINYSVITNMFFISVSLSLILFLALFPLFYRYLNEYLSGTFFTRFLVLAILWFFINLITYYFVLLSFLFYKDSIFKKSENDIEKDLPNFLDNLVSNLKGGISLEKALLKSVRKDQKSLLKEVTLINEKIMMGMTVAQALSEFREKFSSPVITRTFFLIEEGLRGGGNLANPLEKISKNLKNIYNLEEEIKSNSSGFAIIIRAITVIVAPLLFALALTLLTFIGNLFKLLSEGGTDFLQVSELPPEFTNYLIIFSYFMIILITFFSSLITSQLKNEKVYTAFKYLPFYVLLSVILFRVFSNVLLGFFGSILG